MGAAAAGTASEAADETVAMSFPVDGDASRPEESAADPTSVAAAPAPAALVGKERGVKGLLLGRGAGGVGAASPPASRAGHSAGAGGAQAGGLAGSGAAG